MPVCARCGKDHETPACEQVTINLNVRLPDRLLQEFLQHIRNYESQHHDEVHLAMGIDSGSLTGEQVLTIFRSITPPFGITFDIGDK